MRTFGRECEQYRFQGHWSDGNNGAFKVPFESVVLRVIASDGMGWDHVSVSLPNRCPNWREMTFIKELFFAPEEVVMQLHPAKDNYINNHPYCLHLWKPQNADIPLPPLECVGIRGLEAKA